MRPGNPVLAALVLIAIIAALATGFVTEAPNRLITGNSLSLWQVLDPATLAAFALTALALLACALVSRTPDRLTLLLASLLLLFDLHAAGAAARSLAASAPPAARTGLGAGCWIIGGCAALALLDGMQRRRAGPLARLLFVTALAIIIAWMAAAGDFGALSIMREYAARRAVFAAELGRHCLLVLASLGAALAIGLPLGLAAARRPRFGATVFATLNIVQTIPSIALFGLLIAPLSALAHASATASALGISGIGLAPALIALTLYALLPVVRNTAAAITGIAPAMVEAADGMGFTPYQRFRRIELPLGLPVFLAGVRITMVQSIGLAVVAALIGAGGLGSFVFQGIGQYAVDLVLLGAVPAILLALAADLLLGSAITLLERRKEG